MAPREMPKPTTKVQRTAKQMPTKGSASPIGKLKKTTLVKKNVDKTPLKIANTADSRLPRKRTSTVPKVSTPKPKDNKPVPVPGTAVKSAKKASTWKHRPKPAHSGVPIPEKMRKLMERQFNDSQFAL